MSSIIDQLLERLGPAVLLPIPAGGKRPASPGWQRHSLLAMQGPAYRAQLESSPNIGVLLGSSSGGLCSIDVDDDEHLAAFLELNPMLKAALQTRRSRGANIWVRIQGDFPKLHPLYLKEGKDEKDRPLKWGEWRANGGQTVICGSAQDEDKGETEPIPYKIVVDAKPLEIAFEEITWPDSLNLPWLTEEPVPLERRKARNGVFITLPGYDVTILDCASQLFPLLAKTERIFVRGATVVELVRNAELDVLKASGLRSRMEAVGTIMAIRKDNRGNEVLKPTMCSQDIAQALLDSLPARELLPGISLVTGCSVATEGADGNLRVLNHGYHPELGGLLVTSTSKPQRVSVGEATRALQSLLDDFEFQSDSDRSRALASFLSPAFAIGGFLTGRVPADVAEADQSQAGKGYRQKVVAAIYGETPYVVAQRKSGVGGIEESFCQALIAGRPFIQIDNLRGAFDSQFFEAFFTADSIGARVPHKAEVRVDPRRFFIFASSNGVDTTQDFANRSSFIRIRKRVGHQFRAYREGDLLNHVRAQRAFYLGCIFGVIAEWMAFGKPRTQETRHDFREWAQVLDWIIQNIFSEAPLLDGHLAAQERVSNPALNLLRAFCLAADKDGRLDESFTASNLAELAEEHGIEIPGLERGGEERANQQIGIQLKRIFKSTERAEVDGFLVERGERHENRADGRGERAVKHYTIQRIAFGLDHDSAAPNPAARNSSRERVFSGSPA
jgi:hypothetical protein